eukprot:CAMPEP_0185160420 /NCGR_PEP_ID=MMETSP1139-20130426/3634_1 /TAXON_ID=298111 /ORGANISM="Pavlova sp., Strain CCMP459" /LENGTH=59 /DNA_ID=CAMNT_0027725625 /DNA_START=273 /DNA_END=452 /DNA_ORIENTATION=-
MTASLQLRTGAQFLRWRDDDVDARRSRSDRIRIRGPARASTSAHARSAAPRPARRVTSL